MIVHRSAPFRPEYDVCVIGAGPVGISLSLALQEAGRSVLLLESGGEKASREAQALAHAEIVDPSAHHSMDVATARRLGGTSNLWGGRCLPYDPVDFLERPGVVDVRWPIGLKDIAPFLERACCYVDAGAADFTAPVDGISPDPAFVYDTLERWSNTPRLQVLHARALRESANLDVRLNTAAVGFEFSPSGPVEAVRIRRSDGSNPARVRARYIVVAAGGVETARLLLAAQAEAPERFGGAGGPLGRYYMCHVAGQIADIAFADTRLHDSFDFYVDRHGSYVRRRFTASPSTQIQAGVMNCAFWPVVPPIWDAGHGSAILSSIYLALSYPALGARIIPEALRMRHMPPEPVGRGAHYLNLAKNLPSAVGYVSSFLYKRHLAAARIPGFFLRSKSRRYGLAFHSEQWPNPDSRITLAPARDRLGLPKARIAFGFHPRDIASVLKSHELLDSWLVRNRLGRLHYRLPAEARGDEILRQTRDGAHQIGMTRMASTRREGVVDGALRTFDSPNLFVASSSVLPTSGQANPTLTTIALALRVAGRLASELDQPLRGTEIEGVGQPAAPRACVSSAPRSADR